MYGIFTYILWTFITNVGKYNSEHTWISHWTSFSLGFFPAKKNTKILETSFANRLADPEAQQNGGQGTKPARPFRENNKKNVTPPKFNRNTPEKLPKPNRKRSSSNFQPPLSRANC